MKKTRLLSCLFLLCLAVNGQNMVPNADFEQFITCPATVYQFYSVADWINPTTNNPGVSGTPDYFHQCSSPTWVGVPFNMWGYQSPHSGIAYAGIYLWHFTYKNYREYIEAAFSSPLVGGTCYHFEMYINLGNNSKYFTNSLGVYFSDTLVSGIDNYYPLPFNPQISYNNFITDTTGWTIISGDYNASGGESYLLIGNFKNDTLTDTLLLNNFAAQWDSFIFIDDVSLSICTSINEQNVEDKIKIYPNLGSGLFTVNFNKTSFSEKTIQILDLTGNIIYQKNKIKNSEEAINLTGASKGIYFLKIFDEDTISIHKIAIQ